MLKAIEKWGAALILTTFFCLLHTLHLFTHATRLFISLFTRSRDLIEETLVLFRLRKRNLAEEVARMQKKPKHLAVIWVPINHQLNKLFFFKFLFDTSGRSREASQERSELEAMIGDVERLINWARESGVSELSFYDERGLLKKHQYDVLESLAFTEVMTVRDSISLIPTNYDDGLDHADLLPSFRLTTNAGNPDKARSMRINILSRRHGHEHIADVTRKLVTRIRAKDSDLSLNDLNVKIIGDQICSTSIGPPDLVMVLGGRSLRFHGFPPWQLSLTEIYHARSYSILPYKVTYRDFLQALGVFSACEQRRGA